MTKAKILNGLMGLIAIIFLVISSVVFWAYYIQKPWLRYQNLPFNTLKPVGHPGEPMLLSVERCNDTNELQTYEITHALRNEETHDLILMVRGAAR